MKWDSPQQSWSSSPVGHYLALYDKSKSYDRSKKIWGASEDSARRTISNETNEGSEGVKAFGDRFEEFKTWVLSAFSV